MRLIIKTLGEFMSIDLEKYKKQILDLTQKISQESVISSNFTSKVNKRKLYEQKIHSKTKEKEAIEKEIAYLTKSLLFLLFPRLFPLKQKSYDVLIQKKREIKRSIEEYKQKQLTIEDDIKKYMDEQIEIENYKSDLEHLITKTIELIVKLNPNDNELEKLDDQVKELNHEINKYDEVIHYKDLVYIALVRHKSKISNAADAELLDLYDIPFGSLINFIHAGDMNEKMNDLYNLIDDFNQLIKPYNLRLRCNIGRVTGTFNARKTHLALQHIASNNRELNNTLKDLREIESFMINKKTEQEDSLKSLMKERENLLNSYLPYEYIPDQQINF
jgi:hypothetical protein